MHLTVTRDDYFEGAMKILATEGHHALKMSTLCKMLGVTTGSFYNYFGSWAEFTPQLLTNWEKEQTLRIEEVSNEQDDPLSRIVTMKELSTTLPHESEAAIRAWSNGDPLVAEFQRRVDDERVAALRAVVKTLVPDDAKADLLSLMGVSLLIGAQSLRNPVDRDELHRLFDEFERTVRSYVQIPEDAR